MIPTRCFLCETPNDVVLYPKNFDAQAVSPATFSARRLPDRWHYQIVRCQTCGLIRSNPILPYEDISALYQKSQLTYREEIHDLKTTYGGLLRELDLLAPSHGALLEVGCGNGFFLESALDLGYQEVRGVEPSEQAIEQAAVHIKPHIKCAMFQDHLFPPGTFDVVCMFHVLDHVSAPLECLTAVWSCLKPGGLVLCVTHDTGAWSAKLFGERSPIIDIEHVYLYDKGTIKKVFEKSSFSVLEVKSLANAYSLRYWGSLAPLPEGMKRGLLNALKWVGGEDFRVTLKAGNLQLVAQKPC